MQAAKFTQGSITRHLLVMSGSSMAGLVTLFISDLIDMYFLSLLGEAEIAAAVGFAASIMFFTTSISIGLAIACGALVSKATGSGNNDLTKESVTHSCLSALAVTAPIALLTWLFIPEVLSFVGARGVTSILAEQYLVIIIPTLPILAMAMSAGGIMRAQGDAKGAMLLTMLGGVINAALDPIFIFGFGWGIEGAAVATVLSRFAMLAYAYHQIVNRKKLISPVNKQRYLKTFPQYLSIALPAVLTNLSTPIGVAIVTYNMAQFGDSAVAGNAIISRIQPVAFAGLFALSGVVGSIAGQNWGALQMDRVEDCLFKSMRLIITYCLIMCGLLWLLKPLIIGAFNASDEANELIALFCNGISLLFLFSGTSMVTNSIFNNLGVPHFSTILNMLRATLGTLPFVTIGGWLGGAQGVLWGLLAGYALFGVIGYILAVRYLRKLRDIEARKATLNTATA